VDGTLMSRLVFQRKAGEVFLVGGVRVTVIEVRGRYVRLGFEAPEGMRVLRAEIIERDCPRVRRKPRVDID
jgi:carbon storage regulator CsrA